VQRRRRVPARILHQPTLSNTATTGVAKLSDASVGSEPITPGGGPLSHDTHYSACALQAR
jgi:hypothetical protein